MTEQTQTDKSKDIAWERAQEVIRRRIVALRERQAAEKKEAAG